MEIQNRNEGDVLVVKLMDERLDVHIANEFRDKMIEFIRAGSDQIVLNLSKVNFVDSSGLGAIVSGLKAIGMNGTMVISEASKPIQTVFKLTRMDKAFRIFDSENEAITFSQNNGSW